MAHTVRALTRHVESWELTPILRRMELGTAICIPEAKTYDSITRLRNVTYYNNRVSFGGLYWKTHNRPEGFFIERWR